MERTSELGDTTRCLVDRDNVTEGKERDVRMEIWVMVICSMWRLKNGNGRGNASHGVGLERFNSPCGDLLLGESIDHLLSQLVDGLQIGGLHRNLTHFETLEHDP